MEKAGLPQTEGLKTVVIHGRRYPLRFAEEPKKIRFIDLFCGIGGFRIAAESLGWEGVFSCDIDREAKKTYFVNFGEYPHHDIKDIDETCVPDHEILLAGFPCQPFSIIGDRKGFTDTRGTLFFDISRILEAKKNLPKFLFSLN